MFLNFKETHLKAGEQTIFVRHNDRPDLPALLFLHGYPQTSAMWEHVAPQFADKYHVICPDLRGYGKSSKPTSSPDHLTYSKREMAKDLIALLDHFGHQTAQIAAHDRGARVAHRLGLDHPDRISEMALLDIAPTREMYALADQKFAKAYWHWFFLIQPNPIPEDIIGADPKRYWMRKCLNQSGGVHPFSDDALEEYLETFASPEAIHASCEDYRAAHNVDIEHDNADDAKLVMPLFVIWAKKGVIETCFDALALWRQRATNVTGQSVNATHYMAEEIPDEITMLLSDFFRNNPKETMA